jgi:hypothetical protein
MAHDNPGDPYPQYTVVGVNANNESVKDTHLKLDTSKQRVSLVKYGYYAEIN